MNPHFPVNTVKVPSPCSPTRRASIWRSACIDANVELAQAPSEGWLSVYRAKVTVSWRRSSSAACSCWVRLARVLSRLTEKLQAIPAAVHVDGTARIQTIDRLANPRYYGLIEEFGRLTGVQVILNASFNQQEPIVMSPADAVSCYLNSGMDALAIGNFLSRRTET